MAVHRKGLGEIDVANFDRRTAARVEQSVFGVAWLPRGVMERATVLNDNMSEVRIFHGDS